MIDVRVTDAPAVVLLWWVVVVLTALVIVPVALHLLHSTLRKALSIRRFTAEALEAAGGIERNVRAISALDETVSGAAPLVPLGGRLRKKAGRLADLLTERSGG